MIGGGMLLLAGVCTCTIAVGAASNAGRGHWKHQMSEADVCLHEAPAESVPLCTKLSYATAFLAQAMCAAASSKASQRLPSGQAIARLMHCLAL